MSAITEVTPPVETDELCQYLISFFEDHLPDVQSRYKWKVPSGCPAGDVTTNATTDFQRNLALRKLISERCLLCSDEEKLRLAKWYVGKWGGIRRISDEKLVDYALLEPQAVIASSPIENVASWSKIFAYRGFERYAVFDARVSAGLNALQVIQARDHTPTLLFPALKTQGAHAHCFQNALRRSGKHGTNIPDDHVYSAYCQLLAQTWQQLPPHLKRVAGHWHGLEMTLFHHSKELVAEAIEAADITELYEMELGALRERRKQQQN